MHELTELRRRTGAALCLECGKCSTMCPLALRGEFSARLLARHDKGALDTDDEGLARCLTCAACEVRCPQGVSFAEYVRGLRTASGPSAEHPPPHGGALHAASLLMADSIAAERSLDWIGDELTVASEGETALFVGCLPFFELLVDGAAETRPLDSARAAIRVLNRAGIEPVVLESELCCGHDLLWRGEKDAFEKLAKANAERFAERGVKHIVSTCAECTRTWRKDIRDQVPEYQPRVQHFAEFLAEKLEDGTLHAQEGPERTLTYQDPCRLGRHLDVHDAPRAVLAAMSGTTLVEMPRSGKDAVCCGTSGFIHCNETSRQLQAERLQEAAETGADALVTTCPKCLIHFHCSQSAHRRQEDAGAEIALCDLAVLAAAAFAEDPGEEKMR